MATVTGFTAERMLEIENTTVVDGEIQGDDLILITREGTDINAGSVRGEQGPQGVQGPQGTAGEKVTTGMIADFPKSPVPAGWLECDGSVRNIIPAEAALAAYLGTTFGGNGTTTYGLPKYSGLVRVGRDATQAEFDTIGEEGGETVHYLTNPEMPIHAHPHTFAVANHTHPMAHYHLTQAGGDYVTTRTGEGAYAGGIGGSTDQTTNWANISDTGGASGNAVTGGIGNAGSGAPHNNLQPYRVVVTAIKI